VRRVVIATRWIDIRDQSRLANVMIAEQQCKCCGVAHNLVHLAAVNSDTTHAHADIVSFRMS